VAEVADLHVVRSDDHGRLVDQAVDLQPVHARLVGHRLHPVPVHVVRPHREHPGVPVDVQLDDDRCWWPAGPPAVGDGERAAGVRPLAAGSFLRDDPGRDEYGDAGVRRLDRVGVAVEPRSVDRVVAELGGVGKGTEEPEVGREAEDRGVVESGDQRATGRLARRTVHDHLAEHGVVGGADLRARLQRRVDPGSGRPADQRGRAGLREEAVERVLGVDARLDGVAAAGDLVLGEGQRFAGRDPELQVDEVERIALHRDDELGDGVLDLEPGVHLEEEHLLTTRLAGHQELDGAGVLIADLLRQGDRRVEQDCPRRVGDRRRRRLLEDLLVPALRGAVALEEVHHVAVPVGQHLHLDVPAVLHVPLQEDRVVTERRLGLPLGSGDRSVELTLLADDPHPLAAPTGSRLDQHREAHLCGRACRDLAVRHDRDPGRLGDLASPVLAAHLLHHVGRRADEGQAGLDDRPRERCALGEEAVAGVDRVSPGPVSCVEERVDVQVGLGRRRRTDPYGDVGCPDVGGAAVGVGVDGDRADAPGAGGPDDPQRDLPAVRHQQGADRHRLAHILKTP
jgi:hypothetical protein